MSTPPLKKGRGSSTTEATPRDVEEGAAPLLGVEGGNCDGMEDKGNKPQDGVETEMMQPQPARSKHRETEEAIEPILGGNPRSDAFPATEDKSPTALPDDGSNRDGVPGAYRIAGISHRSSNSSSDSGDTSVLAPVAEAASSPLSNDPTFLAEADLVDESEVVVAQVVRRRRQAWLLLVDDAADEVRRALQEQFRVPASEAWPAASEGDARAMAVILKAALDLFDEIRDRDDGVLLLLFRKSLLPAGNLQALHRPMAPKFRRGTARCFAVQTLCRWITDTRASKTKLPDGLSLHRRSDPGRPALPRFRQRQATL